MTKLLFGSLSLLLILLFSSCSGSPTVTVKETITSPALVVTMPTPLPAQPVTFNPITITGVGDKTSAPFTVTTNEWIIDWSFIPDPDYPDMSLFSLFVYPRGETTIYVESVLFADTTSGSTYSYAGPGEYYIKVSAANVQSWTVIIRPAP